MPASPATAPLVSSVAPLRARVVGVQLAAVAVFCALAGYATTLGGYFQGDDFGFVGHYASFPLSEWPRLFVRGWADGLWSSSYRELRPLNALAFIIDARLWDLDPLGYRLTNLALHATSACLVGLIAWRVSRRDTATAVLATGLFALHPVNAHAVAWITGRVDVLSSLFFLAAFLGFVCHRDGARGASLALLALGQAGALFTKESGVTLVGFMVVADVIWLRPRLRTPSAWMPYGVCGVLLLVYFSCRWLAFGAGHGIGRGLPDLSLLSTYLELLRRETAYAAHLLPPLQSWLVAWRDAGFSLSPLRKLQGALVALAVISAVGVFCRWLARTTLRPDRAAVAFFAGGWFVLATVPLMATYFSARHLYLAAPGLCIALALLLRGSWPRLPVRVAIGMVFGVILLAQLWQTLAPWRRGAELSRTIAREVRAAADLVPPGGALLVDVPALADGAFCWSWALPYAIQSPFVVRASGREPMLLQAPANYAFAAAWRRPDLFARLREVESDCVLVEASAGGDLRTVTIAAGTVRAAARYLQSESRQEDAVVWHRFLRGLQEP